MLSCFFFYLNATKKKNIEIFIEMIYSTYKKKINIYLFILIKLSGEMYYAVTNQNNKLYLFIQCCYKYLNKKLVLLITVEI